MTGKKLLCALSSAVIIGFAIFFGYMIERHKLPSHSVLRRADRLVTDLMVANEPDPDPKEQIFDSIFVRIRAEFGNVPVTRKGSGGGLTSFEDAVLLLTHEGKFFLARSAEDIRELPVEAPDNGLDAYRMAAKSERYKHFLHHFHKFRFNDVLFYSDDKRRGLLVSYTEFDGNNDCYRTAVAHLTIPPELETPDDLQATRSEWEIIFRTQPCLPLKSQKRAIEGHMAGGRMAFVPPATVYLASGDYHWDGIYAPKSLAQDPTNDYGKVISINIKTGETNRVSLGHRNMQGIAMKGKNQLWVVEQGVRGGDELNHVVQGKNYGWPKETLGTLYSGLPVPGTKSYGRHEVYTPPVFAWLPSVATSGLAVSNGFHSSWDGDLLVATLKDRALYRIRIRDDRVVFTERIAIGKRLRYVLQHNDGRLVLWTDDKKLMFLSVADQNIVTELINDYIEKANYDSRQRDQVKIAFTACMKCHSLEPGIHTAAPSLSSIFGAPIAASSYPAYSNALRQRDGRWSRDALRMFLLDPDGFANGTLMPDPDIDDPFIVDELINILEAISRTLE